MASRKFTGFARRLANAGLKVSRSDRSETIYVCLGGADLRISGHALGVSDYGTRQQRHKGPEVIDSLRDLPAAAAECLFQARQWIRDSAAYWSTFQRSRAAAALCGLRRLERKLRN